MENSTQYHARVSSTDSRDYEGDEEHTSFSCSTTNASMTLQAQRQSMDSSYEADEEVGMNKYIDAATDVDVDPAREEDDEHPHLQQSQQVLEHLGLDLAFEESLDFSYPFLNASTIMEDETEASVKALLYSEANELFSKYLNENTLPLSLTSLSPISSSSPPRQPLNSPIISSPLTPIFSPSSPTMSNQPPVLASIGSDALTTLQINYLNEDNDNNSVNKIHTSDNISPLYTNDSDSGICFTFEYEFQDQQLVQVQPIVSLTMPTTSILTDASSPVSVPMSSSTSTSCNYNPLVESSTTGFQAQQSWNASAKPTPSSNFVTNDTSSGCR